MASYRQTVIEKDVSSFVAPITNEIGAMALVSSKGRNTPIKVQDKDDVLINTGNPSSTYSSVFEAIAFVSQAPLWITCPYGTNSLWGGVGINLTDVEAFTFGQVDPEASFDFTLTNVLHSGIVIASASAAQANGTADITGTLANTPIMNHSLTIKVGGVALDVEESAGIITGDDINSGGTNTLSKTNGALSFRLDSGVISLGAQVVAEWAAKEDKSTTYSHAFFTASPYTTDDLSVSISWISGYKFLMTLYQVSSTGVYSAITDHTDITYSLIREKDNFQKSIYIEDVFQDDPYLIAVLNDTFTGTAYTVADTYTDFYGGYRETPLASDINTAWDYFLQKNKYKAQIFMDVLGGYSVKLNSTIQTAQPRAHGASILPLGNTAAEAVTARQGLSLDSDNVNIYDCWFQIKDPYNNSFAYISNIGSVGKKYAKMEDIYDSGHPAGIDEDGHGGQLSDWEYVKAEKDYSDADLKLLDEAQINPIIFDPAYGVMIYGNKTAQVTLSDTSYTGSRRAYNFLIENITTQVLRKQEFKNNDEAHRNRARILTDDFIASTVGRSDIAAFSEWYVQCDTKNNNANILNQRKFVLDIFVKVTPDSEFTVLRLTRLAQNAVIAEFIQ